VQQDVKNGKPVHIEGMPESFRTFIHTDEAETAIGCLK